MSGEIPGFPTIEQYFMKRHAWALIGSQQFGYVACGRFRHIQPGSSHTAPGSRLAFDKEKGPLGGLLAKHRGGTSNITDAVEDRTRGLICTDPGTG